MGEDKAKLGALPFAAPLTLFGLRSVLRHRGVRAAATLWVIACLCVLWLADGRLPFLVQGAAPSLTLIEIFVLMAVTFLVTGRRVIPDMRARAPDRPLAIHETGGVLAYAALAQLGGWILGPALGFRPFSFHIAGTVFGCAFPPAPAELWTWALYNLLLFAVVPYLYFCRRYSNTDLNLRSSNRRNDALLVLVVLTLESAFELAVFDQNLFRLSARQMWLGAPLTFVVYFMGTVLPTMMVKIFGIRP